MAQVVGTSIAVFIAAASVISLRSRIFPRWFDGLSLIIALGLLVIAYIFVLPAFVWLLIASLRYFNLGSAEPAKVSRQAAAAD